MERVLDKLRCESSAYRIECDDDGVTLVARDGLREEFSDVVRDLVEKAGEEYVAFPTADGDAGYERVFLLPLPSDC